MRDSIEGKSNGINNIRKNIHKITQCELDTLTIRYGNRTLHEICSDDRIRNKIELVNLVLDRGANIEIENHNLETPLICALRNSEWSLVIHLIDKGANIDRGFIWAAETGNFQKMKFIVKIGMLKQIRLYWNYALYNTVKENHKEMSLYLIDVGVKYAEKNGGDFSISPILMWGKNEYGKKISDFPLNSKNLTKIRGWLEERDIKMGRLIMNRFLKLRGGVEKSLDPFLKLNINYPKN